MGVPDAPAAARRRDGAGDTSSDVPTNTGIEVTFDQDGVVDAAAHMTIAPEDPRSFEQHGRTLAFVPAERLAASTIYTVTVSARRRGRRAPARSSSPMSVSGSRRRPPGTGQGRDHLPVLGRRVRVGDRRPGHHRHRGSFQESDDPDRPRNRRRPRGSRSIVCADLDTAIAAFRQVRAFPQLDTPGGHGPYPDQGPGPRRRLRCDPSRAGRTYLWFACRTDCPPAGTS